MDKQIFYFGVVEDARSDPLMLGRCKVRVVGLHTENRSDLPTDMLPWALPLQPITSAGISGIGTSPTGIVEGAWVMVIFMDNAMQQPIMMGTVGGYNEALPFDFDNQATTETTKVYDETYDPKPAEEGLNPPTPESAMSGSGGLFSSIVTAVSTASLPGFDTTGLPTSASTALSSVQSSVGNTIAGQVGEATASLTSIATAIENAAAEVLTSLSTAVTNFAQNASAAVQGILNSVSLDSIMGELKSISEQAGNAIDAGIDNVATLISAGQMKIDQITDPAQKAEVTKKMQEYLADIDAADLEKILDEGMQESSFAAVKALAEEGTPMVGQTDKNYIDVNLTSSGTEIV